MKLRKDIDGIRAVAVLTLILNRLHLDYALINGEIGKDCPGDISMNNEKIMATNTLAKKHGSDVVDGKEWFCVPQDTQQL